MLHTRYLYLLFDEDNFIHNRGNVATVVDGPGGEDGGNKCVVDAGGYIFNTEAHVIDPAATACCSSHTEKEVSDSNVRHSCLVLRHSAAPLLEISMQHDREPMCLLI